MGFDLIVAMDWTGAQPARGVAVACADVASASIRAVPPPTGRHWTRAAAMGWLLDRMGEGARVFAGIDCAFSLPWVAGVGYLDGRAPGVGDLFGVWDLVDTAAGGGPDFFAGAAVVDPILAPSFWHAGPKPTHWGDGATKRRRTEVVAALAGLGTPVSVFHLAAAAKQVGKASLAGMRALRHLRDQAGPDRLAVWPAEQPAGRSVVAEIYPTLFRKAAGHGTAKIKRAGDLAAAVARFGARIDGDLPDAVDDHTADAVVSAAGMMALVGDPAIWNPAGLDPDTARREGWIWGVRERDGR